MLEIPFSSAVAQVFDTRLGDRFIRFTAYWNDRSNVWTMNLADADTGQVMATSIPILTGQDLLAPYNFGLGATVPYADDALGRDAGADELGGRVKVWWLSPEEVAHE